MTRKALKTFYGEKKLVQLKLSEYINHLRALYKKAQI